MIGGADATTLGGADATTLGGADATTGGGPDATMETSYVPVQIGFEDLPANTILSDQYAAHATFATDSTSHITVWNAHDFGTGQYIQTGLTFGDTGFPLYVDFTKPIRNLSFTVLGANSNSACADMHVVHAGVIDTIPLVGHGNPTTNVAVDLSAYDQVTRLEVVNITDFDSIAFDEFHFDFPTE
jgi:hypothetical protein